MTTDKRLYCFRTSGIPLIESRGGISLLDVRTVFRNVLPLGIALPAITVRSVHLMAAKHTTGNVFNRLSGVFIISVHDRPSNVLNYE